MTKSPAFARRITYTSLDAESRLYNMSFRNNLQLYIDNPRHPSVVYQDEHVVVIKDKYPKSTCHYLVLPVDEAITYVHPLAALADPGVRRKVEAGVAFAKDLAVEHFVNKGYLPDHATQRDSFRKSFIKVGVHSTPSMSNLHIHVLTRDMNLPFVKHKKHYNSFCTEFFVELETFGNAVLADTRGGKRFSLGYGLLCDELSCSSDSSECSVEEDDRCHIKAEPGSKTNASGANLVLLEGADPQKFEAGLIDLGDKESETQSLSNAKQNSAPKTVTAAHDSEREMAHDLKSQGAFLRRRHKWLADQLNNELECTYCGKSFATRLAMLKKHLREEFDGRFGSSA